LLGARRRLISAVEISPKKSGYSGGGVSALNRLSREDIARGDELAICPAIITERTVCIKLC
jgi:hypothetical protein